MPIVKCKKFHRPGVRMRVCTGCPQAWSKDAGMYWMVEYDKAKKTGASLIITSLAPRSTTYTQLRDREGF